MPETAARKFTMADLMILVAGCAAGAAWTKAYYGATAIVIEPAGEYWKVKIHYLLRIPVPALTSIGLALLVCRLRSPRPSLRRLARQPGAVAMACVGLMLLLNAGTTFTGRALNGVLDRVWPPPPMTGVTFASYGDLSQEVFAVTEVGPVLAACWLLLALVGRWRAEPTWIDRAGRCLGVGWIVVYLACSLAASFTL